MMQRLKLNNQLVDIASEGLLRPKLYDENVSNNLFRQKFDDSNMEITRINQL
jgi:TolB-like protein